jgi:CDP-glucose 4,6-dehydratase
MVERIGELWPGGVGYLLEDDRHSPEARYLALDSSRARTRLGWRPLLGLEQALEGTVAWYRQLRDGANMRAATLAQIDTFQAASISPPA